MQFETTAIRTQTEGTQHREHSTPLFPTSSFTYENAEHMRALFAGEAEGNIYSRFTNPNVAEFEQKMALLEGTEAAFATASGMSAIFASFMAFLKSGDHILASRAIFGSTYTVITKFLPRWGISYDFVDAGAPETWEQKVQPNTKIFFLETPSNPGLDIVDLELAGAFSKAHNLILNVDNCFATPYLQRPVEFGAHIITHSATKFIDGQGRVLGGVVCGDAALIEEVKTFCRSTGPSLSPFNAWILSKSLETLAVRMDRHCSNALQLAQFLENHPAIERVNYPFLPSHAAHEIAKKQMRQGGGLVSFEIRGGLEAGRDFLNKLKLCSLSANLGDTRTIATHPASTTHAKLTSSERQESGISDGMIRISVGLEHIDDLVADMTLGLKM